MKRRVEAIRLGGVVVLVGMAMSSWAVTNVWTSGAGGYWADPLNWQDGLVPNAYSNAVDFSALGAGETVTVTNNTSAGSLFFTGGAGDEWTLVSTLLHVGLSDVAPVDEPATIRVEGGSLTVLGAFYGNMNDGLVKAGDGGLRLTATNTFSGLTQMSGGTLFMSNEAALTMSPLVIASPSAALVLESDALVSGLESRCLPESAIDLGGHALTIGGEALQRAFGGTFTNGALRFSRGDTQIFSGTQEVERVCLVNGGLKLGNGVSVAGWWRFDDPAQIGKDSGPRTNHLVQTGSQTQWLTTDPERGSVLSLDGAGAYLSGPSGGDVIGLPVSNMPFTVAFWFKPASDVNSTAGIYAWGVSGQSLCYNMVRLNTPASSKPLMHTNWGNNREVTFAPGLMDGAWHHVAIVYRGQLYQYYIDGEPVDGYEQITPLTVNAGNFILGKGWSSTTFKGLLDDVFIAQGALEYGQIAALRLAGLPPGETAPADLLPETAQVEVAYNGKLRLSSDQSIATLCGEGAVGGVVLSQGATLNIVGASLPDAAFAGSVSGEGALVKRGAGSALTLSGRIDTTGAVGIAEGTLALANRLPPGLQAYYRFDDAGQLGKDSSGHGYDLDAVGSPEYTSGVFGGAASFSSGDQDHFVSSVFPATVPTGNQSYTISVWCNLAAGGNTKGLPVYWGHGDNTGWSSALFRFDSTTQIMTSNMGNNWTVSAGYDLASDAPDGGWHHIACTYDGATRQRRVFFDGFRSSGISTNGSDLTVDGQTFWLGGAPYSTGNYYDGQLDEVMVFDRALDDAEIAEIMTGVFTEPWGSRLTGHVAAQYSFEDAADLGKDTGPHGYHLAPTGSVSTADGRVGQALSLSTAAQGFLNWTNSFFPESLPTGNAPVTITAWVNPVTKPNKDGSMVFWGTTIDGRKGCHLLRLADAGSGRIAFRLVDGVGYVGADALEDFDKGTGDEGWHHVAAVVGPGGLRSFYVDGVHVASSRVTEQTVDPGTFSIGYKPNAATAWYQGALDEVTIYDCALSHAEILESLRGSSDILPPGRVVEVAAGAVFDVGTAAQTVQGLGGAGDVHMSDAGVLTVRGGTALFEGALSGDGALEVFDGAEQTLAGEGTFSGSLTVSNATLRIENASGSVTGSGCLTTVQSGGLLGGFGTISGDVAFESGAGIAAGAGADTLSVDGSVTLGATGVINWQAPEGFAGGSYALFSATTLTAPSGLSGWTVSPAPEHWQTKVTAADGTLTLSVFRGGTLISVQ